MRRRLSLSTAPGLASVALALLLVAAGCGSDGEGAATTAAPTPPAETTLPGPAAGEADPDETTGGAGTAATLPAVESDFPDVVVVDLAGGEVNLQSLAPSAAPVLLWFWAPH